MQEDCHRDMLERCGLCPRRCGANRLNGEYGRCGAAQLPVIYRYGPHHGEEPPISGWRGSGTIFFSGCPLHCVFCQNHKWSQARPLRGRTYTVDELSDLFLELQKIGCHNVNLVTPEPWIPHIISAAGKARKAGLSIPLVYNTSGFVTSESLLLLAGVIDVYLTDIRYGTEDEARELSSAGSYFYACREASRIMWRQVGILTLDSTGIARRGLIVRHLVLPQAASATTQCLSFVARELSPAVHVSLLTQYEPLHEAASHPELGRRISGFEYRLALRSIMELGLYYGWKQRLSRSIEELVGTAMNPSTSLKSG